MTYDFFVFPAELAEDVDEAITVYESTPVTGPLTPDGPMARFLEEVRTLPGVQAAGTDAGGLVGTSWDDPMAQLRAVAGAARPQGLSVLDAQLGTLYDPRDAAAVTLETQGGPRLPYCTKTILELVLAEVIEDRYRWVTLGRDGGVFVQTFREDDGSWTIEHRDVTGTLFAARTEDDEVVRSVLWSWARGSDSWGAMLVFHPITLS